MLRERTQQPIANILDVAAYFGGGQKYPLVTSNFKREAIKAHCFSDFERSYVRNPPDALGWG